MTSTARATSSLPGHFIHLLIHSLTHSLTHPFTRSLTSFIPSSFLPSDRLAAAQRKVQHVLDRAGLKGQLVIIAVLIVVLVVLLLMVLS